jgi:hypothetical protein
MFEAWYNPERSLVYAKISVTDREGKKYASAAKASLEAIRAQRWAPDCQPDLDLRIAMLSHAKLTVGPDVKVRIKTYGDVHSGEGMTATLLFIYDEGWAELELKNFEHVLPGMEPPESDSLVKEVACATK